MCGDDFSKIVHLLTDLGTMLEFRPFYFSHCESSQDVAELMASQGAPEGTIVICEVMSKGRGRLGRQWIAPKGGLWFTIILRPPKLRTLNLLSLLVGISVVKSIKDVAGVNASLKWPNDVLINNKKVAGILIEAKAKANKIEHVLIGIGVNVNNSIPKELKDIAVSIKSVAGRVISRVALLKSILKYLDQYYKLLLSGETSTIINEWIKENSTLGKRVLVKLVDGNEVVGVAESIDKSGRLVVRTMKGNTIVVDVGDVMYLR